MGENRLGKLCQFIYRGHPWGVIPRQNRIVIFGKEDG
jgi:hypothetical protein